MQSKYLNCWHFKKKSMFNNEVESTWVFLFLVIFCSFVYLTSIYFQVLCWALKTGKKDKRNSEQIKMGKLSSCCFQSSEGDVWNTFIIWDWDKAHGDEMSERDEDKNFLGWWNRRKVREGNEELTHRGRVFMYVRMIYGMKYELSCDWWKQEWGNLFMLPRREGARRAGKEWNGRMRDCFPSAEANPVSGLSATSCLHVETCARETASGHWGMNTRWLTPTISTICFGKSKSKRSLPRQQAC